MVDEEEGKTAPEPAEAAAAAPAAAPAEAAEAAPETEGDVEAATGRAPAQRADDRRVAAHNSNNNNRVGVLIALGGGGEELGVHGRGEIPPRAFAAHSVEVRKAHGEGAASKHSPLASKQPPVVDVGMQNKQVRRRIKDRRKYKKREWKTPSFLTRD